MIDNIDKKRVDIRVEKVVQEASELLAQN